MNVTKVLVDRYKLTREQIATHLGCSYRAVDNWYNERAEPLRVYRPKLDELLKERKSANGDKVA